jgi:hypothetical protein
MSSFPILDLVIGMIFIYFLLSIVCSSAVELWFTIFKTRARLLEQWLKRIFDSPALDSHGLPLVINNKQLTIGQAIMDHCMVTSLSRRGSSTSYISAENFFSALMDKITINPAAGGSGPVQLPPKNLDEYILSIQNSTAISGELKRTFLMLANEAKEAHTALESLPGGANITNNISSTVKSELDQFRGRVERWYDTNADRLTGTLKRTKAVPATIIIATLITIGLNADSLSMGKYLYDHKQETSQFADKAMSSLESFDNSIERTEMHSNVVGVTDSIALAELDSRLEQVRKDISTLKAAVPTGLPIGWKTGTDDWLKHIAGWLVTILAICIGAPFWFDLLNKIGNLRSTGPKPASSEHNGKR